MLVYILFFFNDTATTEIYTLSLHDALPISPFHRLARAERPSASRLCGGVHRAVLLHHVDVGGVDERRDRKSTRLNSSHGSISYAVFCLKKKMKHDTCSNSSTPTEIIGWLTA